MANPLQTSERLERDEQRDNCIEDVFTYSDYYGRHVGAYRDQMRETLHEIVKCLVEINPAIGLDISSPPDSTDKTLGNVLLNFCYWAMLSLDGDPLKTELILENSECIKANIKSILEEDGDDERKLSNKIIDLASHLPTRDCLRRTVRQSVVQGNR
ncbi:hypothetical protein JKY72_07090 [Candidatus Gracilibacteria bacterium]|nr:hypothetical protein [Candidatus Gracilibacteria bacterium]